MTTSKISILLVTHNRDNFLAEALNSIIEQTYSNWETIIVNNGTSSSTEDLVKKYKNSRLIYLKPNRNLGECGGRNFAFKHSTGELICYLDDDDILPSNSLATRLAFYNQHPEAGMIYGEYKKFWMDNGYRQFVLDESELSPFTKRYYDTKLHQIEYNQRKTFSLLKVFNFVRGGTPLIKRCTFEDVGLFNEEMLNHGDYEMWLRIAAHYPINFLNEVVYYYRIHAGSTQIRMKETNQEKQYVLKICQKYGIRKSFQFLDHKKDIDKLWETETRLAFNG